MHPKIYLAIVLFTVVALSTSAQQLSLQWAQRFGQQGWDYVNSMIATPAGNYILGGSLKGTLSGDTTHPGLAFSNNAFLASCDTNGNILWQKTFGGPMFDNITSLASTPQGIWVAGLFQDTLLYGNKQVSTQAYTGAYIAMSDEQGNPIWLRNIGGQATIKQILLCPKPQGGAYMAGVFADSLQLAGTEMAVTGEKGFFLASLSVEGNEGTPIVIKGTGTCTLGGVDCRDSLICLAGSFSDILRFADTTLISIGEEDIFIALLTLNGEIKHLITAGGVGNEQINSLIYAPSGEIGITGSFDYSILMQDQILQTQGGKDIFVAVIDTAANLKWLKDIGGKGNDYGYCIATNTAKDYFVSGNFVHTIAMPDENGNLIELDASSAFGNAFIAKYNASGELKASFNLPATSEDFCKSLIGDPNGMITTAGNFYKALQLQGMGGFAENLVTEGERDIFVLRFMDMCRGITLDAGPDTALCLGQSIYLSPPATYPYYRWLPTGLPNQDIEVTQAGTYKLLVTDSNGCIASDSLTVTLRFLPLLYAGSDTTLTAGATLQLGQATTTDTVSLGWTSLGSGYFGNAGQLVTWYSPSNPDISEGTVLITLAATNQCGTSADSLVLSIPQDNDGITAYPNPTQGMVTLVCTEGVIIQSASITTQSGLVILANSPVNNTVFSYDLSAYPPGTFLFHLVTGPITITKVINKL
jgi:hypothetical protein